MDLPGSQKKRICDLENTDFAANDMVGCYIKIGGNILTRTMARVCIDAGELQRDLGEGRRDGGEYIAMINSISIIFFSIYILSFVILVPL